MIDLSNWPFRGWHAVNGIILGVLAAIPFIILLNWMLP